MDCILLNLGFSITSNENCQRRVSTCKSKGNGKYGSGKYFAYCTGMSVCITTFVNSTTEPPKGANHPSLQLAAD